MNKIKITPHFNINGYEFQREIGKGQFSVVWEAIHLSTKKPVAIKCIWNNPEHRKTEITILKEIYFNQKIFHPFICQYYEFFESDSTFFIVFENCSENLVTFSNKRGFLDEKTAHKIFTELLYAVESLHNDYHIIHRDLKVENVLIDSNKNVRLSDFGLSTSIKPSYSRSPRKNNSNFLNQQVGSIYYMSPEMAKKEEYDKSIDIWSLGVILFAITNGKLPFDGNSYDSVIQKILFTQPQFQPHFNSYPQNLKTLIVRMLDKNRKSRITIDEIKLNPWFAERKYSKILELQKISFDLAVIQIDRQLIEKNCILSENERNSICSSIKNEIADFTKNKQNDAMFIDQFNSLLFENETSQNLNESTKKNQNESTKKNQNESTKKNQNESNNKRNEKENINLIENQSNNSSEKEKNNSNANQSNNSYEKEYTNSNENQNYNSSEKENTNSTINQNNNSSEKENTNSTINPNNNSSEKENTNSTINQNNNSSEKENTNSNENHNCDNSSSPSNENNDFSNNHENNTNNQPSKPIEYEKFGIKPRSAEFVTYLIQMREKIKEQMKIEEKDVITNKTAIISTAPRSGKRQMSQPAKPTAPLSQTLRPNVKKPIVPTKKPGSLSKSKKQPLSLTMKASHETKKKKS